MISANKTFSSATYEKIRDQYQKSLHEKKQYSIAHKRWISFEINKDTCKDIEKFIPKLINHFEKIRMQYPKQ